MIAAEAQVVRYRDVEPQPWANGLGVTRVVAVGRFEEAPHEFDWRLSVADVTDGEFSKLPGRDRVITLSEGIGMELTIDGAATRLTPFQPHSFTGESQTVCQTAGTARCFNVMTRRQSCSASIDIRVASGELPDPTGCPTYVVPLDGTADLRLPDGRDVALQRYDTIALPTSAELRIHGSGRAAVVHIQPRPSAVASTGPNKPTG
jgi:environmental stress-induced protein Ves